MLGGKLESARFETVRRLGAGGFGVVFEARDRERGGTVALKTLSRLEPRALYRFKREFRALADVHHPSLLPLYELLHEDGTWFFTMELVDGVDVTSWVRREETRAAVGASTVRAVGDHPTEPDPSGSAAAGDPPAAELGGPPDVERLRDSMRQLAGGIAALHAHGLVHRDLKPSNVLVDATGRVRILDFGLVAERADPDEGTVGTPLYMSPEQAAGRPAGPPSDWYSLGVMLYEALAGRAPHEGNLYQLILAKSTTDPPPPSEVRPEVDRGLERLCMALLAREPGERPSAAEVFRMLGTPAAEATVSARPGAAPEILVGRESHLRALGSAFEAARDAAVVMRVHGASGAGKSHLVASFLGGLEGRARVYSARCFEQETVPYVALDGIVDAVARDLQSPAGRERGVPRGARVLATVFPVMASATGTATLSEALEPHETRRAAARALREVMARLAGDDPVVVHLDDVHWGDADSAPFLLELLRLPRVLLLLSHRTGADDTHLLEALGSAGALDGARELEVGALGTEDVRDLVRLVWASVDPDRASALAERIVADSGGNAMFAHELAARAPLARGDGTVEPVVTIENVILERLRELDPASRSLLEVVAVAGAPVSREIAERAADARGRAVPAIRSLTGLRLLRVAGDRDERLLAPYHDRIRTAATDAMDPSRLRQRHLALADAHERIGPPAPEAMSRHLHAAGEHARALPYTLAAARRASAALAFDRAATLFERAVAHVPADDPERGDRVVELADALVDAGRGAEAAARYLEAVPGAAPSTALELRQKAADQLIRSGRIDRGLEQMNALLDDLGLARREGLASGLASLLATRAQLAFRGHDVELRPASEVDPSLLTKIDACYAFGTGLTLVQPLRGLELTQRGVRMSLKAGEPTRVARALAHEATFAVRLGEQGYETARGYLARAMEIAAPLGDANVDALIRLTEAIVEFFAGHFDEAAVGCAEAERLLRRCPGATWEGETAQRTHLKALYHTGDLARMVRAATPVLDAAIDRRDLYAEVSLRTRICYLAPLLEDEPEEAIAPLDDAIARWSGQRFFLQHFFEMVARVEIDLYRGLGDQVHAQMTERWREIVRSQMLRGQYIGTEARHVRARTAIAAGDARAALALARRMAKEGAPWCVGLADLVRGGVCFGSDPERARAAFDRAAGTLDAAGLRLFAAGARHRLGELEGGDAGRERVDAARSTFAAEGARAPERMVDVFAPVARRAVR